MNTSDQLTTVNCYLIAHKYLKDFNYQLPLKTCCSTISHSAVIDTTEWSSDQPSLCCADSEILKEIPPFSCYNVS